MSSESFRQQMNSRAGIFKESMGARNRGGIGLLYRPARLHRHAEFIPWNRFLDSINLKIRALLLCYAATLCTTKAGDQRVDTDQHLVHLSRRIGAGGGHGLFSDGSLQEQAAWAEAAQLRATAIIRAAGK
jgi:hypothetical protein